MGNSLTTYGMAKAVLILTAMSIAGCSPTAKPCKELILRHLKAPATADLTIIESDERETIGWVDSENSYGANLRNGFVCEIYRDEFRFAFVDEPKPRLERLSEGRPILEWRY